MTETILISGGINRTPVKGRTEGQLETFSTVVDEFENVSARDGQSYSWTVVPFNAGNGDTILSLQNTHDELILHVVEGHFKTDNSSAFVVYTVDKPSIPTAGTAVTGVVWNRKNQNVAEALAFANDQTAHSQENIIHNEEIIADEEEDINFHGAVLLGKGQMIAADLGTGSTALCSGQFIGFFAINDALRV